jgi:hypothetical protein
MKEPAIFYFVPKVKITFKKCLLNLDKPAAICASFPSSSAQQEERSSYPHLHQDLAHQLRSPQAYYLTKSEMKKKLLIQFTIILYHMM